MKRIIGSDLLAATRLRLLGETNARSRGVEDDVLALEEDVAKDAEANASVALDATEASTITVRSVVDVSTWDSVGNTTNHNTKVRKGSIARERVATSRFAVLSTADLLVVSSDNGAVNVEEGGASVSNSINGGALGGSTADRVTGGRELPEALGGLDVDVGD